jgi:hypothetical protein
LQWRDRLTDPLDEVTADFNQLISRRRLVRLAHRFWAAFSDGNLLMPHRRFPGKNCPRQ